jgi:hypothetical protein
VSVSVFLHDSGIAYINNIKRIYGSHTVAVLQLMISSMKTINLTPDPVRPRSSVQASP